jgi:hypothetical protein
MPAYRSVLSHLLGWGLRPGDPAAVFNPKTGQLSWMPVNAQEKVQVGHYHLLKRDYAQAWRWYQAAERVLPRRAPVRVDNFMDQLRALQGPRDFSFFQYHCLTKLGRAEDARAKLDQFRRRFLPKSSEPADQPAIEGNTPGNRREELFAPGSVIGALLQDLYIAEVFLSLDASQDGEDFFRTALAQADTDAARLSRAIVFGQILLLEKKHREYAKLATDTIAPLLIKLVKPMPARGPRDSLDTASLVEYVGGLALLPLGASRFLSRLPEPEVQDMRLGWEKLRARANEGSRIIVDLVLRGIYQVLGMEKVRQETASRLRNQPAESTVLPVEGELGDVIAALHAQMRNLLQRR